VKSIHGLESLIHIIGHWFKIIPCKKSDFERILKGSEYAAFGFIYLPFPNWNIRKFPKRFSNIPIFGKMATFQYSKILEKQIDETL